MFYFVPSWYDNHLKWSAYNPYWFRVYERMEFDDTVNHLKIFQQNKEETGILLLTYNPQLRYFLHRQGLFGIPYWSLFDDIQNIERYETQSIDYQTLDWPEGTDFVFTPFAVVALKDKIPFATIHFAENGNLLQIEYHKAGVLEKVYIFDDRGFLSSLIYHDPHGNAIFQEYFNEYGVWQVRENLVDDTKPKIVVNPQSDLIFFRKSYDSWEELILERLGEFQKYQVTLKDQLIVAANHKHNHLIINQFPEQKKVFSFFQDRYDYSQTEDFMQLASHAHMFVADKEETKTQVQNQLVQLGLAERVIFKISPFDTRLRLGKSQTVKELKILFYADNISEDYLDRVVKDLLAEMAQNSLIELNIVTFNDKLNVQKKQNEILSYVKQHFDASLFLEYEKDSGENHIEEGEEQLARIKCLSLTNENQLIQVLDTTRLVIDLGKIPDLFTQIASISAGVPQINAVTTEYVDNHKNGWVIDNDKELIEATRYYFDGLSNWNKALVYAVDKMSDYTSGRLLTQWKELLQVD